MKDPHLLPVNERGHRYQPTFVKIKEGDLAHRKVWSVGCGGEHTIFYCGGYDLVGVGQTKAGQLGKMVHSNRTSSSHTVSTSPSAASSSTASTTATTSINNSHDEVPRLLPFFLQEKREVLQFACSYSCTIVLLGKRQPSSLKKLCSDVIRMHPEILLFNSQEQEEQLLGKKDGTEKDHKQHSSTTHALNHVEHLPNHLKEMIHSLLF